MFYNHGEYICLAEVAILYNYLQLDRIYSDNVNCKTASLYAWGTSIIIEQIFCAFIVQEEVDTPEQGYRWTNQNKKEPWGILFVQIHRYIEIGSNGLNSHTNT